MGCWCYERICYTFITHQHAVQPPQRPLCKDDDLHAMMSCAVPRPCPSHALCPCSCAACQPYHSANHSGSTATQPLGSIINLTPIKPTNADECYKSPTKLPKIKTFVEQPSSNTTTSSRCTTLGAYAFCGPASILCQLTLVTKKTNLLACTPHRRHLHPSLTSCTNTSTKHAGSAAPPPPPPAAPCRPPRACPATTRHSSTPAATQDGSSPRGAARHGQRPSPGARMCKSCGRCCHSLNSNTVRDRHVSLRASQHVHRCVLCQR